FIGELRDVAHVDTAANDAAGLAHGLERERHERADRGEDDRRIEWYRRQFLGGAGPGGAEPARHLLARRVAGAGEGEDLATLPAQHLGQNVRRGTEAVEADAAAIARPAQRAQADEAGAHERRGSHRIVETIERKCKGCVRQHMAGVTAVAGIAGELRRVAEVFTSRAAIGTAAIGMAEPGDADPGANCRRGDAGAEASDDADDLVAGYQRQRRVGQLAVDDVEVGPADAARLDPDEELARAGNRIGPDLEDQWRLGAAQNHCLHRDTSRSHGAAPRGNYFPASSNCRRRVARSAAV